MSELVRDPREALNSLMSTALNGAAASPGALGVSDREAHARTVDVASAVASSLRIETGPQCRGSGFVRRA
ncbi:MAG: hypothetical protein AAFZ18_38225 [Myxococcota bacterium]